MIAEFNNSYTSKGPIEKAFEQKICGKINSIKYVKTFNAAVPECSTDDIELVIGGEIYYLSKMRECKVIHKGDETRYTSEISSDKIDGVLGSTFEVYEALSKWMKEDDK